MINMERLVPYSGSSSESEQEIVREDQVKLISSNKTKLPCAKNQLGMLIKRDEEPPSNPELHQNRVRSFKHERGNWATHVYVYVDHCFLEEVAFFCQQQMSSLVELHAFEDFHLSLSRTVVLQYHLIENFVKSLENALSESSFTAFLGALEVYVNEEKTRTFIGFKVESLKLVELLKKVNTVMRDFKLLEFYENPSLHISFAWCLGNKLNVIKPELRRLMNSFELAFPNCLCTSIVIKKLCCKIGHKIYNFKLTDC